MSELAGTARETRRLLRTAAIELRVIADHSPDIADKLRRIAAELQSEAKISLKTSLADRPHQLFGRNNQTIISGRALYKSQRLRMKDTLNPRSDSKWSESPNTFRCRYRCLPNWISEYKLSRNSGVSKSGFF